MKVAIFTEDKYGSGFIKAIINRLVKEKIVPAVEFASTYTPKHIKKCHNVSKVKSVVRDVDRVLIIIDKENNYEYDENRDIWRHLKGLKEQDKVKITIIATEPEIEEWICISLGLNFDKSGSNSDSKPSRVLKRECNYKKSDLKSYAEKLDFEKLMNGSGSFRRFLDAISID
ncbi:hypothetical protein [Archaeoglobus sp.]|uniref:hypothetical protein n=1 Tax=Archaeoglobus sp. TaxID=1872626 RepID=UPI0024ABE04F|nr:hypothetical protein [Archaeoglobus sp.]MDI3498954.1 hypothetical protein [Archaeoglobus sp.]